MTSRAFALALLAAVAAPAAADTPENDAITSSRPDSETSDVDFYVKQTTIAERDLATAHLTMKMAEEQRDRAVRAHDPDLAGYWASRYSGAAEEAREASQRAGRMRVAQNAARERIEASARRPRARRGG
jgi:hypothetical protein